MRTSTHSIFVGPFFCLLLFCIIICYADYYITFLYIWAPQYSCKIYCRCSYTHTHTHTHTSDCQFVFAGVFDDTESVKSAMEGNYVILNTDVTKKHDIILWYFNNTRIALINGGPNTSCVYDGEGGRFRDRLEVDYETGSLIITYLTSEHAGLYEAEIIRSESSGKTESLNRNRVEKKCDSTKIILKSIKRGEIIKSLNLTVSGESFTLK